MNKDNKKNVDNSALSLSDWLITIIVASIPIIGFIMLFIWAFGDNTNVNKANWAKANLIIYAIGAVIGLIFIIAAFSLYRNNS